MLSSPNDIDYIICPKPQSIALNIQTRFLKPVTIFQKVKNKFDNVSRFNPYINELKFILKSEPKIIIQIIDNFNLLKAIQKFVEINQLRERIYIQFFFHGFYPFTSSEKIYSEIDELVLLSESSYQSFKENCVSLPVKISINNNGIDSSKFKKVTEKEKNKLRIEYGLDKNKLIFIWCSQDRKKKGLEIIIEAWKELSKEYSDEIELIIIGVNKEVSIENVRVLGRIPNDELVNYYQLSDFYLFPTLCQEGFGLTLAEALKCGAYCIASNNGSVKEVLGNGRYGTLINNPNNVDNWISEIKKIIKNYKLSGEKPIDEERGPLNIYDLKDWNDRNKEIIQKAKNNFSNRLYL